MKDKLMLFPERTRRPAKMKPPTRPGWLHELAADEWDRLAPAMTRNGWLDEITAEGFARVCELGYEVRRLDELVDELGLEKATTSGVYAAMLDTQRLLLEYLVAYFMTPASRAKHGVEFKPAPGA